MVKFICDKCEREVPFLVSAREHKLIGKCEWAANTGAYEYIYLKELCPDCWEKILGPVVKEYHKALDSLMVLG